MDIFLLILAGLSLFTVAFVYSNVGVGGGVLYMPIMLYLPAIGAVGVLGPAEARPLSLSFVLILSIISAFNHHRRGLVDLKFAGLIVAMAIGGVILGLFFGVSLPAKGFYLFFALLLAFMTVRLALDIPKCINPDKNTGSNNESDGEQGSNFKKTSTSRKILFTFIALGAGFASITLGIGGGAVLTPVLLFVLFFPLRRAAGTIAVVNGCLSSAGLILLLGSGVTYHIELGIPWAVFIGLGAFIGSHWGLRKLKTTSVLCILTAVTGIATASMFAKLFG